MCVCQFDGCGEPATHRDLCQDHDRQTRHGKVLSPVVRRGEQPLPEHWKAYLRAFDWYLRAGAEDAGEVSVARQAMRDRLDDAYIAETGRPPEPSSAT